MYTLQEILDLTVAHFTKLKLETPRLDAEVLLADLLGKERIDLYISFDQPLKTTEVDAFRQRVILRSQGCPIAYITGKKEFFSREFLLSKGVLIPRPETEHLVEAVVDYFKGKEGLRLADIGTGSGNIAISLALALPSSYIYACDLYPFPLQVAQKNCQRYGLLERIALCQGDLLTPLKGERLDAIVSNPPYVSTSAYARLSPQVRDFEPKEALLGGPDGLFMIRLLIQGGNSYLKEGGLLALEIGHDQKERVEVLLKENSYQLEKIIHDYGGNPRVVLARRGLE